MECATAPGSRPDMAFIFVEEKRKVEGSLELDRAKGGLQI